MRRSVGTLGWAERAATLLAAPGRVLGTRRAASSSILVAQESAGLSFTHLFDRIRQAGGLAAAEWIVAVSACLWAVLAHLVVFWNAGPLWRDEANSLNQAAMGTLADAWARMEFDSFPILWCLVLRAWLGLGFDSDPWLRALGLTVGLGTLAMFWWIARVFRVGSPLLSLTLAALAPSIVWYGDSLRAYGLGMLLILWAAGSMWRVVENPSVTRIGLAGVATMLAAHSLYYNTVHLAVIGMGAVLVCAWRRRWKAGAAIVGIGAVCGASMLAYLPSMSRRSDWVVVITGPVDLTWLLARFVATLELSGEWMPWVWSGLIAAALAACLHLWLKRNSFETTAPADQAVFWGWVVAGGLVCHFLFLLMLRFPTQYWYYVTLIAVLGLGIDTAIGQWARLVRTGRIVRVAAAAMLVAIGAPNVWAMAHMRATNVDRIVEATASASPDDLIVLTQWEAGIAFHRYYHGRTPWITIPDIADHTLHRYDQLKAKMSTSDAIAPELQRIRRTLADGHRVWLAGGVLMLPPGVGLTPLPPAPHPHAGWSSNLYERYWLTQTGQALQESMGRVVRVSPRDPNQSVNQFENLPLTIIEGRR
jgi:hypothetical protein